MFYHLILFWHWFLDLFCDCLKANRTQAFKYQIVGDEIAARVEVCLQKEMLRTRHFAIIS